MGGIGRGDGSRSVEEAFGLVEDGGRATAVSGGWIGGRAGWVRLACWARRVRVTGRRRVESARRVRGTGCIALPRTTDLKQVPLTDIQRLTAQVLAISCSALNYLIGKKQLNTRRIGSRVLIPLGTSCISAGATIRRACSGELTGSSKNASLERKKIWPANKLAGRISPDLQPCGCSRRKSCHLSILNEIFGSVTGARTRTLRLERATC